ncbi:MAG: tetratricopeptide repeat protein, partial [Terriglobia bacterium]
MRKSTALWSFTLLVSLMVWTPAAQAAAKPQHVLRGAFACQWNAPPQAAQAKNWKSRDEYDAYTAMGNEKDPNKKISLAEAFLQKFSNSDFKSGAYVAEMQAYFQLGKSDQAIEAAKKVLEGDPDNLDALGF